MCINCIRSKVDITEGIQRQVVLFQCRGCERYVCVFVIILKIFASSMDSSSPRVEGATCSMFEKD